MEIAIKAKHNYVAAHDDELSFKKREVLTLISVLSDRGWWQAKNAQGEGLLLGV